MEKFCIVKRRKQNLPAVEGEGSGATAEERQAENVRDISSYMTAAGGRRAPSFLEKKTHDGEQIIRIQLTPEQCTVARKNESVRQLLGRTIGKVALDIEESEDGQIIFNFHLKQVYGTKTLNPHDVCEMLQISKSFLSRLVKEGKMKSYKIGRLRRFLLEDILEYLTQTDEVLELLSKNPDANGSPRSMDGKLPEG
jgi:excisionase family DNA binding protein